MKALTLWEPWASLMAWEKKKVETRGWATRYRGPIAIHAALKKPSFLGASEATIKFQDEYMRCRQEMFGNTARRDDLFLGCILCIADLVSIEETTVVRGDLSARELIFGNYEDGRYAWFFENVQRLDTPIAVKGNRMLWNWNR